MSLAFAEMALRDRVLDVVRSEAPGARICAEYAAARARFETLDATMRYPDGHKLLPAGWSWPRAVADDAPQASEPVLSTLPFRNPTPGGIFVFAELCDLEKPGDLGAEWQRATLFGANRPKVWHRAHRQRRGCRRAGRPKGRP